MCQNDSICGISPSMPPRKPGNDDSDLWVSPEDRMRVSSEQSNLRSKSAGDSVASLFRRSEKSRRENPREPPFRRDDGPKSPSPPRPPQGPRRRSSGGGGRRRLLGWLVNFSLTIAIWMGIGLGGLVAFYAYDLPDLESCLHRATFCHVV